MATEKQKKAMTIFETLLTLLLNLFRAHHAQDMDSNATPHQTD